MNTKSLVKSSVMATVYRAHTTTSPISEASLTWETTPKLSNFSEIGIGTKVRDESQDPCINDIISTSLCSTFSLCRRLSWFHGPDKSLACETKFLLLLASLEVDC